VRFDDVVASLRARGDAVSVAAAGELERLEAIVAHYEGCWNDGVLTWSGVPLQVKAHVRRLQDLEAVDGLNRGDRGGVAGAC
jgi:hypothetical protein